MYFALDGFDLGIGVLRPAIGKTDEEKRQILSSISPLWNGNEVWLITAGGATFAAFPVTYALMFSYLYTPLLLILFSLILRGVAVEFIGKSEKPQWQSGWSAALFLGSLAPALLFGVAFGNIFQGLPMDAQGYHGSLLMLLNQYGILTGALFVLMFLVHGALWLSMRTEGGISRKAAGVAGRLWYPLLAATLLFLIDTAFATNLYANYLRYPALLILPLAAAISLLAIKLFQLKERHAKAFYASLAFILTLVLTGVGGLYPELIPSSIDPAYGLNINNSSSSVYTLRIMTIVAVLFVPVVIAYQAWVYRVFGRKTGQ